MISIIAFSLMLISILSSIIPALMTSACDLFSMIQVNIVADYLMITLNIYQLSYIMMHY